MASAAYAGSLCQALQSGKVGQDYRDRLEAMISHSDGARGFFVTFLTDPDLETLANTDSGPAPVVRDALKTAPADVVASLAVMNVIMPTATAIRHQAAGDETQAANSRRTASRGGNVLRVLLEGPSDLSDAVRVQMTGAQRTAEKEALEGDPEWVSFFGRWKYDKDQLASVNEVLSSLLATVQ